MHTRPLEKLHLQGCLNPVCAFPTCLAQLAGSWCALRVDLVVKLVPQVPQARRKPLRARLARPRFDHTTEDGDVVAVEGDVAGCTDRDEGGADSLGRVEVLDLVEKRVSGSPWDREDPARADDAYAVEACRHAAILP